MALRSAAMMESAMGSHLNERPARKKSPIFFCDLAKRLPKATMPRI